MKVHKVAQHMEILAPQQLAESWDNVGLLIGDANQEISGILVTLDVTNEVVDEAIANRCNLIVSHHPIIFTPYKSLVEQDVQQSLYRKLIKHDISVYSAHTNLDNANGGMNDWLAEQLGLENIAILKIEGEWEGNPYGTGRVGTLKEPMTLQELTQLVHSRYTTNGMRFVGNPQKKVKHVALIGGAAQGYYKNALLHEVDVFITGDMTYHVAQEMLYHNLCAIDPGHYIESICIEKLVAYLAPLAKENDITIMASKLNTDALNFI